MEGSLTVARAAKHCARRRGAGVLEEHDGAAVALGLVVGHGERRSARGKGGPERDVPGRLLDRAHEPSPGRKEMVTPPGAEREEEPAVARPDELAGTPGTVSPERVAGV